MAKTFRCSIVTPAAATLDAEVTYASFPAWDGQMGVMAGRSPLLTRLGVGILRVEFPTGEVKQYLIDSGFAQVHDDNLTLLTERALTADQVPLQAAENDLSEANARAVAGGKDMERIEHDQRLALAKKALASRSS